MNPVLIIHHHPCPDGFTSFWVAQRFLVEQGQTVIQHEGNYGQPPPLELAQGRDVYILDFSYPRARLLELAKVAKSLVILDHHKTAQAALQGVQEECAELMSEGGSGSVRFYFDMHRSGAGMTWDYFHGPGKRHWIVEYTQARDLWKQDQLPDGAKISLFLRSLPMTVASYDRVAELTIDQVREQACGVEQQLHHYVRIALREARLHRVQWTPPPTRQLKSALAVTICCSYDGVSDVLDAALARHVGADMAIGWRVDGEGIYQLSLRSRSDFDCSEFARAHGGGGHAQAAGCRLDPSNAQHVMLVRKLTGLDLRHDEVVCVA